MLINDRKTKPVIRRGKTGKKAVDEVYINLYACDIGNNRAYRQKGGRRT